MFDAPAIELSTTPATSRTASSGHLPRAYLAVWVGLTCVSSLYITQVALENVNLPRMIASAPETPVASPQPDRALRAELATMRQNLTEFQRDVGRVRSELEAQKLDSGTIAGLSALEERMSMTTGVALAKAALPATPTPAQESASSASSSAPPTSAITSTAALEAWAGKPAIAPAATAQAATAQAATAQDVAAKPQAIEIRPIALAPPAFEKLAAPIETGSIAGLPAVQPNKMSGQLPKSNLAQPQSTIQAAAPAAAATAQQALAASTPAPPTPIAFGPAVVKAEPKPFAVQLASGTSIDEIRYSWSILSEQNADSLGKLQPRYTATTSDTSGPTFDLVAGPVKTAADAKRICKALATRGIDCKITSYSGETF